MAENAAGNEKDVKALIGKEDKFLKCLNEEFRDRYTEADVDYKKVWESDLPMPPILLNFDRISDKNHANYNRDRRQRRYNPFHWDNRNNRRGYGRWD